MPRLATNTCAISIDITAPDDKASWYDLWQAAVVLDGLCARVGKTGKARFLGRFSVAWTLFYFYACRGLRMIATGANRKLTMEIKRS